MMYKTNKLKKHSIMITVIKVETLAEGIVPMQLDSNSIKRKKDFMGVDEGFFFTRNGRFYQFVSSTNRWYELRTLIEYKLYVIEKILDDDFIHLVRTAKSHQNVRDIYSAYILSRN